MRPLPGMCTAAYCALFLPNRSFFTWKKEFKTWHVNDLLAAHPLWGTTTLNLFWPLGSAITQKKRVKGSFYIFLHFLIVWKKGNNRIIFMYSHTTAQKVNVLWNHQNQRTGNMVLLNMHLSGVYSNHEDIYIYWGHICFILLKIGSHLSFLRERKS